MTTIGKLRPGRLALIAFCAALASACVDEASLANGDAVVEPVDTADPDSIVETEEGPMPASISPELAAAFERNQQQSDYTQRVIITLEENSSADVSAMQGVNVLNRMQSMPIIVAEIDANGLKALADSPAIKRVEPDGEMQALPE